MPDWLLTIVSTAISLGVAGGIAYSAKSYWDRKRWRTFTTIIEEWAKKDVRAEVDLNDDQWRMYVANWLAEAGFTPSESVKYLELAVLFAKARTELTIKDGHYSGTDVDDQ